MSRRVIIVTIVPRPARRPRDASSGAIICQNGPVQHRWADHQHPWREGRAWADGPGDAPRAHPLDQRFLDTPHAGDRPATDDARRGGAVVQPATTDASTILFAIYDLEDMAHVAATNLTPSPRHRTCEVGIAILDPERRGKGLGTEAVRLITDYAFHALEMHNVHLSVLPSTRRDPRLREGGVQGVRRRREAILQPPALGPVSMDVLASEGEPGDVADDGTGRAAVTPPRPADRSIRGEKVALGLDRSVIPLQTAWINIWPTTRTLGGDALAHDAGGTEPRYERMTRSEDREVLRLRPRRHGAGRQCWSVRHRPRRDEREVAVGIMAPERRGKGLRRGTG